MTATSDSFIIAGGNALSFLEYDHGFSLYETIAPPEVQSPFTFYKLTYRKDSSRNCNLFVCLATAPARLELDLEFGRGWPTEYQNTINVFELLAIESPDSRIEFTSGICEGFGDLNKMTDQYTTLATELRHHGGRFFSCDPSLWDDVRHLRESRIQQQEIDEKSRLAESAFKQEDWGRAISLYESLGEKRSKLQSARLAYARKNIAK
jgi:hypothetical protein